MVGHMALNHGILVRFQAPQPCAEKTIKEIWRGEVGHMALNHGIGVRFSVPQHERSKCEWQGIEPKEGSGGKYEVPPVYRRKAEGRVENQGFSRSELLYSYERRSIPCPSWTKSELFSKKIRTLNFDNFSSGGKKGRGLGGRNFCPPSLFRRRRISFFSSQKAPQEKVLPLPQPSRARATTRNSLISFD